MEGHASTSDTDTDKKNLEALGHSSSEDAASDDTHSDMQAGVKKVEAISASWTKWGLVVAYITYVFSGT